MILSRAIANARAMMRSAEWGDSSIPPNSAVGFDLNSGSGPLEGLALSISTVLACVKVLHDDVKSLPFSAHEGNPNGAHRTARTQPQIVCEPFGPDLSPGAGMGQLVFSKAMRGNAYCYVAQRDRLERPTMLTILHPDHVTPRRGKHGKEFRVGNETFGPHEIIHITGLMAPGAIAGLDVLTAQRVNFDLAMKVGRYANGFFGSGGSPAGVISVPGPGNRAKAREVLRAWQATHGGVDGAHTPAVVFGGATWTQLSVTPENAQFLETRRFLREEICGIYGVPLQRIQAIVEHASQGGGKGVDMLDRGYVMHTVLPLVIDIEQAWNRMIPDPDTWTAFDVDGFLRAAAHERAQIAQIHRVTGVRMIDEIRGDEGWEPLPDGLGMNPFAPLNSNTGGTATGGDSNTPSPTSLPNL